LLPPAPFIDTLCFYWLEISITTLRRHHNIGILSPEDRLITMPPAMPPVTIDDY